MSIVTGVLPTFTRREMEIKTGMNDLGDILLSQGGGSLSLKLVDEQGQPIQGARLNFPLENGSYEMRDKLITDTNGQLKVDLDFMASGPRQVLHLSPPWGFDKNPRPDIDVVPRITYDMQLKLDNSANTDLKTSITHGHTLTVRLIPSETGKRLAQYYADTKNWNRNFSSYSRQKTWPYFAARGFALEKLDTPANKFRYHQHRTITGGVSLTSGTQEMVIRDVPSGRLGLRIDGGFYNPPAGQKSPTEAFGGVPIAYTEVEMPTSDHTVTVELNPTEVDVELDSVTPERIAQHKIEFMVFMRREEPISTVLGSDTQRALAAMSGMSGKDPESIQTSLVGYESVFESYSKEGNLIYRPATFLAVPPGRYTLKTFKQMATIGPAPKALWEERIEVKTGSPKIVLRMPFPQ